MEKINIKVRVKPGCDLSKLSDFTWTQYDFRGLHYSNGVVTIYDGDGRISYNKLTQKVFDCILELVAKGVLEPIKND